MEIKILRGTVCGGVRVLPGDVVKASARDARLLLSSGKAELAPKKKVTKKKAAKK